jgi:hypothetical protein
MLQICISENPFNIEISGPPSKLKLQMDEMQYMSNTVLCCRLNQEALMFFMLPHQYAGSLSYIKCRKILQVRLLPSIQVNRLSHVQNKRNQGSIESVLSTYKIWCKLPFKKWNHVNCCGVKRSSFTLIMNIRAIFIVIFSSVIMVEMFQCPDPCSIL